jgi:hypothetical protein
MKGNSAPARHRRFISLRCLLALGLFAVAATAFILFVHPFLAVTQRVDADVLVVEGWIPDYMLPPAAREFHEGNYSKFLVSGLEADPGGNQTGAAVSDAGRTASRLEELGVPHDALMPCPTPFTGWLRTSKTARAVREKTVGLGLRPKGINVITAGPHARETWVAYQHNFGDAMPVGIISIPKTNYPADSWWLSRQGWKWVPKDFIAWLKEVLFGLRS